MLAFLAPGQGSQTPGMLTEWLELPGAAERIASWSEISGLDLARLGTTATAEEITDTAVTQPLVVAATLLAYEELNKRDVLTGDEKIIAAGHSVGEIAAYAIAGVISADDAVSLAATRGKEMAKACALEPTGMSALLGISAPAMVFSVAMGAAAAFLTPIGHHGNLLVYEPGGYRFFDFLRAGTPLTLLLALVVAWLAPMLWPVG